MNTTCWAVVFALVIGAAVSGNSDSSGVLISEATAHTRDAAGAARAEIQQDKPQDIAGTWALSVETAQGSGNPTVTFKQDGEKLTGTYSSQIFGEQQVTGTIKGSAVTFGFAATVDGNKVTVTYSGTVEKDTMKGKVSLGDLGEGTFTGKKKQ